MDKQTDRQTDRKLKMDKQKDTMRTHRENKKKLFYVLAFSLNGTRVSNTIRSLLLEKSFIFSQFFVSFSE